MNKKRNINPKIICTNLINCNTKNARKRERSPYKKYTQNKVRQNSKNIEHVAVNKNRIKMKISNAGEE